MIGLTRSVGEAQVDLVVGTTAHHSRTQHQVVTHHHEYQTSPLQETGAEDSLTADK